MVVKLELDPQYRPILDQLVKTTGLDLGEVFKRSLAAFNALKIAQADGAIPALLQKDGAIVELDGI